MAEDLAGDLVWRGAGDFDELSLGRREMVGAREVVAQDGLDVAVLRESARPEFGGGEGGFRLGGGWHYCLPACAEASARKLVALSAPEGSSSCLK